ncbi:unnamed protein product [Orchesella dallaii]|uniref:Gustatory receptor n=1 Tax=Orchesella dallaii TaxID=48710 RepID=A0ABP1QHI9_9HEXA
MRRYSGSIDSNNRLIRVHSGYSNVYDVNSHLINVENEEYDYNKVGESDTLRIKHDHTPEDNSFLAHFFNFFYYLLLIPFKTVLDKETNQYRIKTNMVQKIFCIFFHIAVMFSLISFLLLGGLQLINTLEPRIVDMFDFFCNLSICVSSTFIIFMLWRRKEKYLEVIESTRIQLRRAKKIKILIYLCITILSISWCIGNWMVLREGVHYVAFLNLADEYLLAENISSNLTSVSSSPNSLVSIFNEVLNVVIAHVSLIYIVIPGSFLMLVLTMRQLGKILESELKIGNKVVGIWKGNELYRSLKANAELTTRLYGRIILAFYIASVCYFAQAPHVFFGERGNIEKLAMAYLTLTGVVWILAAEFHKNVQDTVVKWIEYHSANENLSLEDRLKLVSFTNEVAANPVALSSGYFSLTYELFSSMLGMVITYGIIVFQLHNGPSQSKKEVSPN